MHKSTSGFTIVELLIAIVVIAVLAGITVTAYSGIQRRAYDTSVQADLSNIVKKMEIARVSSATSTYPTTNPDIATATIGLSVSKTAYQTSPDVSYNLLFCWPSISTPTQYALLATSKSGKRFYVYNIGVISEYTGGTSWSDSNIGAMCASVIAGSSASGAGYSSGDTATGPWRSWTGQ